MIRLVSILLLTLYTTFNVGLVVNTHFCGGKLASISILTPKKKSCGVCGTKKMANSCCKDTQTELSIDGNQIRSQTNLDLSDFSNFFTLLHSSFFLQTPSYAVLNKHNVQFYVFETGPPKTPIYIQIHSLLI